MISLISVISKHLKSEKPFVISNNMQHQFFFLTPLLQKGGAKYYKGKERKEKLAVKVIIKDSIAVSSFFFNSKRVLCFSRDPEITKKSITTGPKLQIEKVF